MILGAAEVLIPVKAPIRRSAPLQSLKMPRRKSANNPLLPVQFSASRAKRAAYNHRAPHSAARLMTDAA